MRVAQGDRYFAIDFDFMIVVSRIEKDNFRNYIEYTSGNYYLEETEAERVLKKVKRVLNNE